MTSVPGKNFPKITIIFIRLFVYSLLLCYLRTHLTITENDIRVRRTGSRCSSSCTADGNLISNAVNGVTTRRRPLGGVGLGSQSKKGNLFLKTSNLGAASFACTCKLVTLHAIFDACTFTNSSLCLITIGFRGHPVESNSTTDVGRHRKQCGGLQNRKYS
jgi:hypothetical protein